VGGLTIDATRLTTLSMPALTTVSADLDVTNDVLLTAVIAPLLRTVNGALVMTGNTALRQCVADGLKAQLTTGPSFADFMGNDGVPNTCP
jgi:hypothetical protein